MRQIVLDTETTGIGHDQGHRIIEIGCVELAGRELTGRTFHTYLNPEREVDEGAFKVHGISSEFLKDKRQFQEIWQELFEFINGAELVIHNAPFDIGFLNAELGRLNHSKRIQDYCTVLDTLVFAKQKHPGQRNNLDALCKRYDVENSNRQLHGALLDAEILARVYLAMTGGQSSLFMEECNEPRNRPQQEEPAHGVALSSTSPVVVATEEELRSHQEFIDFIVKKSGIDHWSGH